MLVRLVVASLFGHRARTLLAVAGVAVSAALLLDMVMLSTGMSVSFRSLLLSRGFQLRVAPKGTLPFDTEATIADATATMRVLRESPEIEAVSPVLGGTIHVPTAAGTAASAVALGIEPRWQGDYELVDGREPGEGDIVANDALLVAIGRRLGDTLTIASGYDPQLRRFAGTRRVTISGRAHFVYLSRGQRAVAMPIASLQSLGGAARRDRASLMMIRARPGTDVERVRAWIAERLPRVTAISTETALAQVEERLSYFRQLAFILGSVSLVVGVLLVGTLVTVSVNERIGEFAVLRAIGVAKRTITAQIMAEGAVLMLAGALLGLALGLVTARYLNTILSSFPGLPQSIDFFLFQPRAAWTSLGMLAVAGVLAGAWPAWRGASLPVARTLREEAA
ncbi:MAG TPA: FtsX-like permease family protein [Gemmatimonadaceae bacterium]|nr:FtsX-like permease family protein [Gemmatimonadaceae bacterium]